MAGKQIDIAEMAAYMKTMGPDTKIYFGCDSERFKVQGKWFADYIIAVVVHINGKNGGRIFAQVQRERDVDQKLNKPFNRLMTEAQKLSEFFNKVKDIFYDFECELHLDIASDESMGSNCAAQAAVGYIRGTCNVVPLLKPQAWAASFGADRAKDLLKISAFNA